MTALEFAVFTEPQQGASYETLLGAARTTEDVGFDAFFRSDHVLAMGDRDGRPGPTDAWITLAGLARETSRVRLGTLVTAATFRVSRSIPIVVKPARANSTASGRPTYPSPMTPTLARRPRIRSSSAVPVTLREAIAQAPASGSVCPNRTRRTRSQKPTC